MKTVFLERESIEQFFSRFINLEWLNTHTCMCQNAHLCNYPCKNSNLGLK